MMESNITNQCIKKLKDAYNTYKKYKIKSLKESGVDDFGNYYYNKELYNLADEAFHKYLKTKSELRKLIKTKKILSKYYE